ncbi:MAG TPA: bifunctional tRNA (5-methylaminomethyl-2-thiouridine)(34)-methyltransferase MnmD/FAD-dependent 5-carboxymethylaminomethyl-2-thiouridine(34) oxidoreductase MnmC [Burkholderiaceae bacterium]|nr:bifunctional tRNA (5-methylaminomethyl-2-thiouridine)(34)-methyltransferase MnmD/FAD-dependent 5-carboxymethylaminomethyl-2-thiouridine(34) oxidoreductase MnmC [Burkholderiaceae bacterium]
MSVQPERLGRDASGAPYSERYRDVYASRDGALGQAMHVFLGGNRLPQRWRGRRQFVILETGFGLGVNFLATWKAWRDDSQRPDRLHFVSVERHPLPCEDLLAGAPAPLLGLATLLAHAWPRATPGLHRIEFESGGVTLTLAFGDARNLVPDLELGTDAIYLDGFAPARNPEMWEPGLLKAAARSARPGATVATYTSAPAVRDALAAAGFELQLQSGFGQKRRMVAGTYAPRWRVRRHEPPSAYAGRRDAIVVGAGLAGSACAEALARRGWSVRVLDSDGQVASGASALPWGLLHPQFALDDSPLVRLTRAGTEAARAALDRVAPGGDCNGQRVARESGVLQLAGDFDAERWRHALDRVGLPPDFVQWCSADAAAERIGMRPRGPGLWWPEGMMVAPARWCRAMLERHAIVPRSGGASRLVAADAAWHVLDARGSSLDRAPVVVVAAALASPPLLETLHARVRSVRGRIAFLQADAWSALCAPVSGEGYLIRDPDGGVSIGATYEDPSGPEGGFLNEQHALTSNLARVSRLLAAPPRALARGSFDGVRCVAHDRMPHAGAVADERAISTAAADLRGPHLADLPRRAGLYASFALGSRGLTLAALLAELVAARIEGEPLPVERSLAATVDPARFALQALRRGSRDSAAMRIA